MSKHHSRDAQFLSKLNQAIEMDYTEATDGLYPWKCGCGRINKKWATECAVCYGPWTDGTRHRTEPRPKDSYQWESYNQEDWDAWSASSRSSTKSAWKPSIPPKQKAAQQKTGKGKAGKTKKGKGTGKGKAQDQESPFKEDAAKITPWASMDATAFTPSTSLSPNPFAAAGHSGLIAEKQEWMDALRKAYPDPNSMPEETKMLVEKTEREYGRRGIKNLHQASTYLGKVKDHLGEVQDHKRAHRALWMKHLAAGIQIWEKQLEEYRRHQAFLTDQASKARNEITATSRIIQQLSHTAGGSAPAPSITPTPEVEEVADKEEEGLKQQLQSVLRSCASSLGMELDAAKLIEVEDGDEQPKEEDKPPKRQRSLEPFGGHLPAQ